MLCVGKIRCFGKICETKVIIDVDDGGAKVKAVVIELSLSVSISVRVIGVEETSWMWVTSDVGWFDCVMSRVGRNVVM